MIEEGKLFLLPDLELTNTQRTMIMKKALVFRYYDQKEGFSKDDMRTLKRRTVTLKATVNEVSNEW
jgi:hypothetical protein